MGVHQDIGPSAPSRMQIYHKANELERLARLARELSEAGPGVDLPRAAKTLERARELLREDDQDD